MIQRPYLAEWRKQAPWALETQVEQDLVLSRAIVEIFSDPLLRSELAFRGGTALHKLYMTPAARYSEDIDLVQMRAGPIGSCMSALRNRLDSWLGEPRRKQSEGRVTFFYPFESESQPVVRMRLKVEINTREHFSMYDWVTYPFAVESPWIDGSTSVTTYRLEELLGTKLRALYQRRKGRDLFDLAYALATQPDLDLDKVVACFKRYTREGNTPVSRREFELNLDAKQAEPSFGEDVLVLLRRDPDFAFPFSIDHALEEVRSQLIARL